MNPTIRTHHRQRRIFYGNTLIWSIGNSLTSSIVLIFILEALGFTSSMVIAWVFAAPFLGRIFQPLLPYVLNKLPFRRNLCVFLYWAQVLVLWLMLGVHVLSPGKNTEFWLMLFFWALACVLETMAYAVLLSWNRLLFPGKTLGRYFSRREAFKIAGEIIPIVCLAIPGTIAYFSGAQPGRISIPVYFGVVAGGSLLILVSSFFFFFLPEIRYEVPQSVTGSVIQGLRRLLRPFGEKKFWPFLIYSALFSFFLQFEQVSQTSFQKIILGGTPFIPFLGLQALRTISRAPQLALAPWIGKLVDRYGTLNVMIFSQILTGVPLLLYAFTSPGWWWMLYVAALIWASYVGINVALPKLQLEISDPRDDVPWLAAYGFAGSVAGFIAVFLGGFVHHEYSGIPNFYTVFFLFAFGWRVLLALPLVWAKWKRQ